MRPTKKRLNELQQSVETKLELGGNNLNERWFASIVVKMHRNVSTYTTLMILKMTAQTVRINGLGTRVARNGF